VKTNREQRTEKGERRSLVVALVIASVSIAAQSSPQVDADALMQTVRALASPTLEGRLTGTAGSREARRYIRDAFIRIGLAAAGTAGYEQPFSFTRSSARRAGPADPPGQGRTEYPDAANLIGRVAGTDSGAKAIVITAHYDHVGVRGGRIFPGADDNASGVAALIAVARYAIANRPRHPMIFAALDAEELGLEGAKAFLRAPPVPRSAIGLNINLDMVSRSDRNEIYAVGTYHYPWTKPIVEEVQRRSSVRILFGHDRPKSAGASEDDWTLESDHGAFHQAGLPFVYFGVEDHPDYHQPTDTADRIDPAFFRSVVDMLIDAVMTFDQRMN
jgi:hypothetical protein